MLETNTNEIISISKNWGIKIKQIIETNINLSFSQNFENSRILLNNVSFFDELHSSSSLQCISYQKKKEAIKLELIRPSLCLLSDCNIKDVYHPIFYR